jgi:hypothetical protein
MFSKAIAISALAASASGHILMHYPVPFGKATLNTSPLEPADFPCKQRQGVYAVDTMNTWNAGQTQNVSFMGTAVHGGGSCQFSITTDPEPDENSQWKVIQSVIGGCPTALTDVNFDEVAGVAPTDSPVPDQFPVTMPADIPEGRYTFAWTWNNKVGNREFYMNCAPIQVGGGSGKASTASAAKALSALPDMFVSNLPATQCTTDSNKNFVYPDPGQNVKNLKTTDLSTSVTGSGCATINKMGAGNGQMGSPSAGTPSTPSTPSQGSPSEQSPVASSPASYPVASPPSKGPTESKAPLNPGGVFAPGASSAPASKPTPQPEAPASKPVPSAAPPAAKPVPSAAPQTPSNSTPSNGECTPCTNDGAVVCIGSKQFGLCNRGCAVAQDLAAGMSCQAGAVVASTKRHINFPRAHIHRRLSAAHLL